jgi:riboflavin-specific deaminase-like protein
MKRPYITVSYGQTLDGRLATVTGDSQWIGGEQALQYAHELRRDNQGILVGIGTVLKDNPRLTCRLPEGRNPIRVVLDTHLRIPLESALVTGTSEAPTWVVCGPNAESAKVKRLVEAGVRVALGGTDPDNVVRWLTSEGIESLFVEGGATVITSFLRAGLVDRLAVVTAPFVMGSGLEAIGDLGSRVLSQVARPLRWSRRELGDDLLTELIYRENPGSA